MKQLDIKKEVVNAKKRIKKDIRCTPMIRAHWQFSRRAQHAVPLQNMHRAVGARRCRALIWIHLAGEFFNCGNFGKKPGFLAESDNFRRFFSRI